MDHGLQTVLVSDASRGVSADGIEDTKRELVNSSALLVDSQQVSSQLIHTLAAGHELLRAGGSTEFCQHELPSFV